MRILLLAAAGLGSAGAAGADRSAAELAREFTGEIRPILREYCLPCHSTEKQKGELDLERIATFEDVRRQPKIWQAVAEQLATLEMPPADKPQPAPAEKTRLAGWTQAALHALALERAGDPGPVVLRRLSNAEYTYSIRDLTGVAALDPAREFPVDGAAGEGFMNTGQALVMSPALVTKYLDAAKAAAAHAVPLPDGLAFFPGTTRRDWVEDLLGQIRSLYSEFTDPRGGARVNLQGIQLETNAGGRLPLEKYLAATLAERDALAAGHTRVAAVAQTRGLSPRYLAGLFALLQSQEPSLVLDPVRARWRRAGPDDAAALAAAIEIWQKSLWKFNSVGHIGKRDGPTTWLEPVTPLQSRQELRLPLTVAAGASEAVIHLAASDAGDGTAGDVVVWERPRLVAPGRPELLLRDVRAVSRHLAARRTELFGQTARCLEVVAEAEAAGKSAEIVSETEAGGKTDRALAAWQEYLGTHAPVPASTLTLLRTEIRGSGGHEFVHGWGEDAELRVFANSSAETVRIPGTLAPRSVAVLPGARRRGAVGWCSPAAGTFRIEGAVTHAHVGCGNGIRWSLELRRGRTRQTLAAGTLSGGRAATVGPFASLALQAGDLVSLVISSRGDPGCDLTGVNLKVAENAPAAHGWDLAADVAAEVLAGNPHADRQGHEGVWHFYAEPEDAVPALERVLPTGSLLARWQTAPAGAEKRELARRLQALLEQVEPPPKDSPDAALRQELAGYGGPLFSPALRKDADGENRDPAAAAWGIDPAQFGAGPEGAGLTMRAPANLTIHLPAELAAGSEFVTTGTLDPVAGAEGSVQLQLTREKPDPTAGVRAGLVTESESAVAWTGGSRTLNHSAPIIVAEGSQARRRFAAAFQEFRQWFPAALCYHKIVPVDEVVTLTLFHREDDQLVRLMLDETQQARLDRLWSQLRYVSQDALTLVDAFEQLWQFATQDADPSVFEPLRRPIQERAAAFRREIAASEPRHLEAVIAFATRAFRRPLAPGEEGDLRALYASLRSQDVAHDEAVRLVLARVLVSPHFLYRAEAPGPGAAPAPVAERELATRLSYFLWSSVPDAPLRALADAGRLRDDAVLSAHTRRMTGDARVRRLATEFACQWLHIRDVATLDEKSERHFPTFGGLRADLQEEAVRFFTDLFQGDRSVLSILDADHTFLNGALAAHYGVPGVVGDGWRRVDGMKARARGGILGQAAGLARQSGASRTSPILRGIWVAEAMLGERLPRPPKDVPRLPEDEAAETLTVRQLTERHTSDPRCSNCHARIDPLGFALEQFDAIGRQRERNLGGRPIDTHVRLADGTEFDGLAGLRDYLLTRRREAFVRQFNRKLLGYALGRSVQLSDEPLLAEMQARLAANEYRVGVAIDAIVRSRQFRDIRGREMRADD